MVNEIKLYDCSLCQEVQNSISSFENGYKKIVENGKNIIYKTDQLNILPSIGALNNYHLMVVPKYHCTSISRIAHSEVEDLLFIIKSISKFNFSKFKLNTIFFEHGSCIISKNDSSCIEHAHLHAVATNFELLEKINLEVPLRKIRSEELFELKNSYILYIDHQGEFWINDNSNIAIKSQLIRRVYCEFHSPNSEWNWRKNLAIDNVIRVIDNYKDFSSSLNH